MPVLKPYQSTQQAPQGSAMAAGSAAEIGQANAAGIEGLVQPVAKGITKIGGIIQEKATTADTTKIAADFATAQAELTKQWQDTLRSADPNDKDVATRFQQEVVQPRLDALGQSAETPTGKFMVQRAAAGLKAHFYTSTSADQAELTGVAAVKNYNTVTNQLSDATMRDPASFANNMALADLAADGLTDLPAQAREQLRKGIHGEIAKAAVLGLAQSGNFDQATANLNGGIYNDYLSATDKQTLLTHVDTEKRAAQADQRAALAFQRQQDKDQAEKVASDISSSLIKDDGSMGVPPDYFKSVSKYGMLPGASDGTVRAMESAGRQLLKEGSTKTDPSTHEDFMNRMFLSQTDDRHLTLQEVDEAFGGGNLSKQDYALFHRGVLDAAKDPGKAVRMQKLTIAMGGFQKFIDQSTMLAPDAFGRQRWSDFRRDKMQQFDEGLQKGLSPDDMVTPGNKAYIFNDVRRYEVPNNIRALTDSLSGRGLDPQGPVATVPWANAPAYNGPAVTTGSHPPTNSTLPKWDGKEDLDTYLKRIGQ